jgi:hypothetical protein
MVQPLDGATQIARLTPSSPSSVVEAAPSRTEVIYTYLRLRVERILSGVDLKKVGGPKVPWTAARPA